MGLKYRKLEKLLRNKFCFVRAKHHAVDHKWYELEISDGPTIRTKVSHGSGELGEYLEGKIAKQLRVRTPFFREMMSFRKDFDDYCSKVLNDPYSPFHHRP